MKENLNILLKINSLFLTKGNLNGMIKKNYFSQRFLCFLCWTVTSSFIGACSTQNKVQGISPKYTVSSNNLVEEFVRNEKKASIKYVNEVILVYGTIEEVSSLNEKKTILIKANSNAGIICEMNENQNKFVDSLQKNQSIYLKGICKGYLKDVILLNCFIDSTNNYE